MAKSTTRRGLKRSLSKMEDSNRTARRGVKKSRDVLLDRLLASESRAKQRAGGLNEALGGTAGGLADLVSIPGSSADTFRNMGEARTGAQLRTLHSQLPTQQFRLTSLANTAEDQARAQQEAGEAAVEAARAAAAAAGRSARSSGGSTAGQEELDRTAKFDTVRTNALQSFDGDFLAAGEALTEQTGDVAYLSIGDQLARELAPPVEEELSPEEVFGQLFQEGLGFTNIPGVMPDGNNPGAPDAIGQILAGLGGSPQEIARVMGILGQIYPALAPPAPPPPPDMPVPTPTGMAQPGQPTWGSPQWDNTLNKLLSQYR